MARRTDPWSRALVNQIIYGAGTEFGVLLADDVALHEIDEALSIAERSGDDLALGSMWSTTGIVLVHRDSPADRERGLVLLGQVRDLCLNGRFYVSELRAVDVYTARERAARGDRDEALPLMGAAVKEMFDAGQFAHCDAATGALVETLLDRGADGDITEAEAAIEPGWPPRPPTTGWSYVKSGCCGCVRCWPRRAATRPAIATIGIVIAPWRHRWASRDIWSGPRRCHDGGRSVPHQRGGHLGQLSRRGNRTDRGDTGVVHGHLGPQRLAITAGS